MVYSSQKFQLFVFTWPLLFLERQEFSPIVISYPPPLTNSPCDTIKLFDFCLLHPSFSIPGHLHYQCSDSLLVLLTCLSILLEIFLPYMLSTFLYKTTSYAVHQFSISYINCIHYYVNIKSVMYTGH